MPVSEFGLIRRYFAGHKNANSATRLGIGDDCALLQVPAGYQLAVTTDTMVEGVHFFAGADPETLGHKLLAVNLSDLASMGAQPIAVTLALTLPNVDENWLQAFANGLRQLAEQYDVDLIGGDTTSGPLTLTLQAMGIVPENAAMLRSRAQAGDLLYVTGRLGDAGLGLKIEQGYSCSDSEQILRQFNTPNPRIREGLAIRDIANACIDLSDGLASDLGHILEQSGVGARIAWDKLPLSAPVRQYIDASGDWLLPLTAGDDYELCFTVPPENQSRLDIPCTCIGVIDNEPGLRVDRKGRTETITAKGYEHFS
ncbi:thiamine-phosphate kinase [Methylomarinum sp. Ch1-1]|uniref:Thiamine-monophosphate kinase n=1 Tax=Methylomarinum roseum TaxID=3067653 RepID=A0AAU7NQ05_9GAMM|nr:thiamine-phosphate kinase [Methylomarinum sp. Ch1-1]MDP4521026.1 thiamine-phosphate kinase [Methylomarinum sp. Ch1-1]